MAHLAVFPSLFAFLAVFLLGRQLGRSASDVLTSGALVVSAVASFLLAWDVIIQGNARTVSLMEWISSGDLNIDWALRLDPLSVVMLCVITLVSACVHIYSIGYMEHDESKPRFMSYLSLFTFAMIMLVTADNLVQLFFGWEGVGLASYLLIGFWNTKPSANSAAMKAFIVNRIGDFGLTLGIFTTFIVVGSVQFDAIFASVPNLADKSFTFFSYDVHALTLIGLLLFIGAVGKSAQLGLHTWLPDAMEGPTPVSALIHAATMVTAGVFLVARFSPLYEYAPLALLVITIFGTLTALLAATIALTQFDIKRVIAYSTMSQLGYMFLALGVSAYGAAMFHLVTHAFFKALLFLGAGSVIHALEDEQDMRKMGGLWNKIPITYVLMWIGSLALAGIPFFAGFYSKDIILEAAWADSSLHGDFAYAVGVLVALMTAFYSFRLIFMTFHGADNVEPKVESHIHESPNVMLIPLYVLAIGAVLSGAALYGGFVGGGYHDGHNKQAHTEITKAHDSVQDSVQDDSTISRSKMDAHVPEEGQMGKSTFERAWNKEAFWAESIQVKPENDTVVKAHSAPLYIKLLPAVMGAIGILLAALFYFHAGSYPERVRATFEPLHALFFNKWYFDEIYDLLVVRPVWALGRFFSTVIDRKVIDRFGPDGFANVSRLCGVLMSRFQTGYIFQYAFVIMIGLMVLLGWILYKLDLIAPGMGNGFG